MKYDFQTQDGIEAFCDEIASRLPDNPKRKDVEKIMSFIIEEMLKNKMSLKEIKKAFESAISVG